MSANKSRGDFGEDFACRVLTKNGYKIISRNFRCKLGEIDIISVKDKKLIFTEVKSRWNLKFGEPEEAVTYHKLVSIKNTANYYFSKNNTLPKSQRIEVFSIIFNKQNEPSYKIIPVY